MRNALDTLFDIQSEKGQFPWQDHQFVMIVLAILQNQNTGHMCRTYTIYGPYSFPDISIT
jgi:hypothetical protein